MYLPPPSCPETRSTCCVCKKFAGALEYLSSWVWQSPGVICACGEILFCVEALPLVADDLGVLQEVGAYAQDAAVFSSDRVAFEYLVTLAQRDLKYRGFRDERITTFTYRTEAPFQLYQNVRDCQDEHEYALLRQRWDAVNRPGYVQRVWSERQQHALDLVEQSVSYEDEEAKCSSNRWLFIKGRPGSGKSLVLLEMAVRCAKKSLRVLIVCPAGTNVYSFKSQIPEFAGAELIGADTIQAVLKYKRPGQDSKVSWTPPSALRRIDVLLCDEASQFADPEWQRFFTSIKEQPHLPYTVVCADFQQLPPVGSSGLCLQFCQRMQTVELDTVYRTSDPEHMLFQSRICEKQPTREFLEEYFEHRHWQHQSLERRVARGMQMAREAQCRFTWLTATNTGAEDSKCVNYNKYVNKTGVPH